MPLDWLQGLRRNVETGTSLYLRMIVAVHPAICESRNTERLNALKPKFLLEQMGVGTGLQIMGRYAILLSWCFHVLSNLYCLKLYLSNLTTLGPSSWNTAAIYVCVAE